MIHVVLDCIVFDLQPGGGISRYWVNLIAGLAQLAEAPHLHLLIHENAATASARQVIELARANPRCTLHPYRARRLERIREPAIPHELRRRAVFHSSYYRFASDMPNVLTVHDFTYEETAGGWRATAQHWQKSRALARSAAVVCVTESTRLDFRRRFPNYRDRPVEVIHHGVESHFSPHANPRLAAPAGKEYVLFVGRRDSYKNFWPVVNAVARLSDFALTVVGPPLTSNERLRLDAEIGGRYTVRSQVSDRELIALYRDAFALAYPSRYEGFGLPVLEAMACGCPVVAQRASSIPEVAGEAAMFLDEVTPVSLASTFERLRVCDVREQFSSRGLVQAARFAWKDAAERYLRTYSALST